MEKKSEKPPKTVKIHVIDRCGKFEADPTVPVNTTIRGFMRSAIKHLNLPPEGPIKSGRLEGGYRSYQLINKRTGSFLRGSLRGDTKEGLNKTFADLDIKDGDIIKVTEIILGEGADRKRLEEDYKALKKTEKQAKEYITLKPSGNPPDFYEVELKGIPGIERIENNEPVIRTNHKFTIDLKKEYYPEDNPEIHFITPIFHPYIFQNNKVCVTDGWSPAFPIDELFVEIIDRIQCESPIFPKNVAIPANSTAHKWYIANKDKIKEVIKPVSFLPRATNRYLEDSMTEEDGEIRW